MTEGADQQLLVGQFLGRMQTLREVLDRIDRTGVTILGEDLSDVAEHLSTRDFELKQWAKSTLRECEAALTDLRQKT